MEFLKVMSLRGPNIWTYRPAVEAWVDIGALEDSPSNTIPGFYERLTAWLPSLIEHRCGVGERGGFLQRVREGTWPGHILEHVTIELQNMAGMQSGFGKARETSTRGVYKVVVRARNEQVSRACLYAGRDLVMAAIEDRPFDVPATVAYLRSLSDELLLGPSTACIVDAATERHIPSIRLSEGNLVQLGYGASQRRIWTAETSKTSAIAESISSDKDLTKSLLQACGVPIPEGRLVDSPEDAWEAAEDIGTPVVVKPQDGNHGRGVSTDLHSREEIEAAYQVARGEGSGVIVERFIRGNEHRLLVVGGRLVAAARGESASVMGNGHSTIEELIDSQLNTDPRRGTTEDYPLNQIHVDDDPAVKLELTRQGFTADSIPQKGMQVLIQRNGNVAFDVTDQVHPSVAATVSLAARVVGLDIAGIDLVAEDISRPLDEQGGAIVEVNAGPGLLMHLKPVEGTPRPVGKAIVDNLFPQDESGRIPIVGITGTNGKTVVARIVARLIHLSGKHVGLTCSDGVYLDRRQVEKGNQANWTAAHKVTMNPSVEAAVFETDSGTILSEGLAYDRCQVAVVTNIGQADHLGEYYIESPEKMYNVMRTLVDVVLPEGFAILNANDPLVAEMASLCDGTVILFAIDPAIPAITEHLAKNGRAVYVRDEKLVMATGTAETSLTTIASIPLTCGGKVPFQIENILAATGAAWALGISHDLIRAGIESFDVGQSDAPGRFSVFEHEDTTIVVDNAHNASALEALVAAVDQYATGKRSIVYAAGANRRGTDLIKQGEILGNTFDHVVIYDNASVASTHSHEEARKLLRQGIESGARVTEITEQQNHQAAIEAAIARTKPGEILVLQSAEGNAGATANQVCQLVG
ncbi:cyanophycin synthetase [Sulfurirhabdus autotrophica]|uniref:Cyanophycin synthetase n=1 Tax=Sulfurirhabdus autotrophica TaxID=1706046 RepID=A0A4V2W1Y2_9PROT|nr:cyanophycin synthetase [Sulfurirhabdus autotrophica]TCV85929.1 cyanophycin synthetase [Sulfurirhabdus autotrophica]